MIVTFIPEGQDEKMTLSADGLIIDPASWIMTFVGANGDKADVEIDDGNIVIIEDEGGDEGEQAAG